MTVIKTVRDTASTEDATEDVRVPKLRFLFKRKLGAI